MGLTNEQNFQYYMNAVQGRKNCLQPDLLPYFGRDFVQTTNVPMPGKQGGSAGWAEVVDLESNLRNFQNRNTDGGCDDLRSLELPLAWTMNYLPWGWQQPDDIGRISEYSRFMIADTCRPVKPFDQSGFYETRNCNSTYTNCNPQLPVQAVYQHRLAYP